MTVGTTCIKCSFTAAGLYLPQMTVAVGRNLSVRWTGRPGPLKKNHKLRNAMALSGVSEPALSWRGQYSVPGTGSSLFCSDRVPIQENGCRSDLTD